MKKMTKKERSAYYLKRAKDKFKDKYSMGERVSFLDFPVIFPELHLINGMIDLTTDDKIVQDWRVWGYLLAHEMAK